MLSKLVHGAKSLSQNSIFRQVGPQLAHDLRLSWVVPDEIDKFIGVFELADMFKSTLKIAPGDYRFGHTHHLLLMHRDKNAVALSGLELGCGESLQEYMGEYHKKVLFGPTCLVHMMEVRPEFRGLGLQSQLWSKISEHALQQKLANIAFNPIEPEKYSDYFARYGIDLESHSLSQPVYVGTTPEGKPIYRGEELIQLAVIREGDIGKLLDVGCDEVESRRLLG